MHDNGQNQSIFANYFLDLSFYHQFLSHINEQSQFHEINLTFIQEKAVE